MAIIKATQKDFETQVLESDIPVLVDLWAPWCGPCKALEPAVGEISSEYEGKIKVVKVNIDDSPGIASQYHVMSIPTLLIFSGGKIEHQIIGLVSKDKIVGKLEPLL